MSWRRIWQANRRAAVIALVAAVGLVVVPRIVNRRDPPTTSLPTASTIALQDSSARVGNESWAPWPQALHDAQHSGTSPVDGPTTGEVRWSRDLGAGITPGPVIGEDGTIYASTNDGILLALDPLTGKVQWRLDGGSVSFGDLSTSPAVLPSGSILWLGADGQLSLVSADGRLEWRKQLSGLVMSPAVQDDETVAIATDDGTVLLLDVSRAEPIVRWSIDLGARSYGSPVLSADGSTVYQSVLTGVVALREGKVVWRSTAPADIVEVSAAVAPDGTVVVGSNDFFEYGLDPSDGHTLWRHNRGTGTYSSPIATTDGLIYFGDDTAGITALTSSTGDPVFRFQGSREMLFDRGLGFWTAPVVDASHRVYGGTRQGIIYGVGPDGPQLFSLNTSETIDSYPALTGDGALIVGDSSGVLRAIADN